ncbi:MAG: hypothetical protein ACFB5Z_02565 [Elainellaceae cyanobacterium]
MPPTPLSPDLNPEPSATEDDFDADLRQVEQSVQALRDRYSQVTAAQQAQKALRAQQARLQHELKQHRTAALKQELKQVKTRIDELELTLESQLFSWGSLSEPFWQAVRFGGLGLIVGWFLRAVVG